MSEPLTKEWLINVYLFGLDLTDDNGNPFPDDLYDMALNSAREWLQTQAGVVVGRKAFTERHDFDPHRNDAWITLKVDKRPLRHVNSLKFRFGGQTVIDVPGDWIVEVLPVAGQINVVPGQGGPKMYPAMLWPYFGTSRPDMTPGWYEVNYDAGRDINEMPADELHLMGMYAAMFALNPAGDLLGGAGIASRSVNLDGVGQSISTTSSATNAGYGARIIQYEKDIRSLLPRVRRRYYGAGLEVV